MGQGKLKQGDIGAAWRPELASTRFAHLSDPELDLGIYEYQLPIPQTKQAKRILDEVVPEALSLFLTRNRDYGDAANELGERAQFVDMNRKMKKLKRALWDGEELVGESPEEICRDLIGHCLLTIDFLQRNGQLAD